MADQNQFEGKAKEIGGNIKEGVGDLTGNDKLKGEGKIDQAEGKVQGAYGDVKDKLTK